MESPVLGRRKAIIRTEDKRESSTCENLQMIQPGSCGQDRRWGTYDYVWISSDLIEAPKMEVELKKYLPSFKTKE